MSQRPAYNLLHNINTYDASTEKAKGLKQDFDQVKESLIGGIGAIGELMTTVTCNNIKEPISDTTIFNLGYMLTNLTEIIAACDEQSENCAYTQLYSGGSKNSTVDGK